MDGAHCVEWRLVVFALAAGAGISILTPQLISTAHCSFCDIGASLGYLKSQCVDARAMLTRNLTLAPSTSELR